MNKLWHLTIRYGILAGVFLLSGCGSGVRGPQYDRGQFAPLYESWKSVSSQHGHAIKAADDVVEVKFGDVGGDAKRFGLCVRSALKTPVIYFDEVKWNSLSPSSQESLFFHEMGHCSLGRDHASERGENRPKSLMNPSFIEGVTYEAHKEEYLQELFGG